LECEQIDPVGDPARPAIVDICHLSRANPLSDVRESLQIQRGEEKFNLIIQLLNSILSIGTLFASKSVQTKTIVGSFEE
jgi:hypothetical protein